VGVAGWPVGCLCVVFNENMKEAFCGAQKKNTKNEQITKRKRKGFPFACHIMWDKNSNSI